ncbi:MAG TPA: response regulator transcription factor, partial [Marmoricola sp.]
ETEEGFALLREAIEVADAGGVGGDVVRGYINLASTMKLVPNEVTEAARIGRDGLAYAARHSVRGGMTDWLRMEVADIDLRLGRFDEAEQLLAEVRTGWITGVNGQYFHTLNAWLDVVRGRIDEAEEHYRLADELAPSIRDPQAIGPRTGVRMLLNLAQGRLDAGDAIETLAPLVEDSSASNGFVLVSRLLAAAARAGSPDAVAGVEQIRSLFGDRRGEANPVLAANLDGWLALLDAELATLRGEADVEPWRLARQALAERENVEQELYAHVRLVDALARAGEESATEELAAAHARVSALGAAVLAGDLEQLARQHRLKLAGAAASPQRLGALTSRETEVLTLVAEGRTNREIGEKLFITEKTASVHVSNILAKLGVSNRGEAAALARQLS